MIRLKKNRFNSKVIFIFLVIFIVVYLLLRAFPSPTGSDYRTFLPEEAVHYNSFKTQAILIKDEIVYSATDEGTVETFVEEGSRVKAGTKVAVLTRSGDGALLEEELSQLNKSITELRNIQKEAKDGDISKSEVIKNLKNQIQDEIDRGNFDKVYLLKEKILNLGNSADMEAPNNRLLEMEAKRKKLSKEINESIKNYYLEEAAMVSYDIDGFEDKYRPKDFEKYTYNIVKDDIRQEEDKSNLVKLIKEDYSINDPIFKSIDNFKWNLAIKVDDLKRIKALESRKTLNIELLNIKEELEGKIVSINRFKNSGVIILEFRSRMQEFYSDRFVDINIIESKISGYKIPKSVTTKKGETLGVYVKDSSNIVNFRPIVILSQDKNNFYVDKGDENGYIYREGKDSIRSISLFDEIFLNPSKVKEGKIMK